MSIPVENIYYLLCYAWNRLEERDLVDVESIDSTNRAELFARVLATGVSHLLRRGIDQSYCSIDEEGSTIRGRLDASRTVRGLLHLKARAHCVYDDLNHNVLRNQILRTTLGKLSGLDELSQDLRFWILSLYKQLSEIDDIELNDNCFRTIYGHRNNLFYDFLMHICELLYRSLLVSEQSGAVQFRDFLRDERQMAYVFEEFVRNFYCYHLSDAKVESEDIRWSGEALYSSAAKYLPRMRTDTSITFRDRKVVVDTKYYATALQTRYEKETIISSNLYQLNAYLKNLEQRGGVDADVEGILLYPVVARELDLRYELLGHKVTIATINLNQPWQGIHSDLLTLVN